MIEKIEWKIYDGKCVMENVFALIFFQFFHFTFYIIIFPFNYLFQSTLFTQSTTNLAFSNGIPGIKPCPKLNIQF